MSIKGLDSILKQREQQFGNILGEKVQSGDVLELLEELKIAIGTLADNQKKIYMKLDEIDQKIGDK